MNSEKESEVQMSNRVLDAIKEKGIEPKPKWHFLLKEWFIWSTAGFALLLGSIATTLSMYIVNTNRLMERVIVKTDSLFYFKMIPFVWLGLFVVGFFYTVYAVRETKKGYRWNLSWLVGIALVSSVALGSVAYASGAGVVIDEYLLTKMPIYRTMTNYKPGHWMDIEKGIVIGLISDLDERRFTVMRIDTSESYEILYDEHTKLFMPIQEIPTSVPIEVHGEKIPETELFYAREIVPFRGRGRRMMQTPPYIHNAEMHNEAMIKNSMKKGFRQGFFREFEE